MTLSLLIANFIYLIHLLVVIFILLGWFIISTRFIPFYIIFIILIMMAWNDPSGACLLTTWEHYFRTGVWINKSAKENNAPEFFRPFIQSIIRTNISRETADRLNNFLFLLVILISFIRFYMNCKK